MPRHSEAGKNQTPYLQYLQVIDDHRVSDEYEKTAKNDLRERRNKSQLNGCVVKPTTIYLMKKFIKNIEPPKVNFISQSYNNNSLIHRLFGGRIKDQMNSEIERIVNDSMKEE